MLDGREIIRAAKRKIEGMNSQLAELRSYAEKDIDFRRTAEIYRHMKRYYDKRESMRFEAGFTFVSTLLGSCIAYLFHITSKQEIPPIMYYIIGLNALGHSAYWLKLYLSSRRIRRDIEESFGNVVNPESKKGLEEMNKRMNQIGLDFETYEKGLIAASSSAKFS